MEPEIRKMLETSLRSLPEETRKALPETYEKVGDILIIYLASSLLPFKKDIGEAYKKALNVKTVLLKGRIKGEYRIPDYEIIAGSDTVTIHKENSILYKLDLTKVMFSAGNISERIRMSRLPQREKVVDMFAGIGYFSLPIAKFCHSHVSAVEKNEDAYNLLCENIILNKVEDFVTPFHMDCKDFEGTAERVIMGHPEAYKYLEKAFEMVEKGFIHYHEFTPEKKLTRPHERLYSSAEKAGKSVKIKMRKIKKYSPGVWHTVCDCEVF